MLNPTTAKDKDDYGVFFLYLQNLNDETKLNCKIFGATFSYLTLTYPKKRRV